MCYERVNTVQTGGNGQKRVLTVENGRFGLKTGAGYSGTCLLSLSLVPLSLFPLSLFICSLYV